MRNHFSATHRKLRSTITWTRRLAARTAGFVIFMLGAVLCTLGAKFFVLPFQLSSEGKTFWVRRVIQRFFQFQLRVFSALGAMNEPRFEGLQNLPTDRPCIIAANHPTLIDILLLGSQRSNWICIVKHSLWRHLFLGEAVRLAGYVPNDVGSKTLRACEAALRQGACLIVFPEGKRSPRDELHSFSYGAVYLALKTHVPIIPAVIQCNMVTLNKELKWYQVPERTLQMAVRFHEPIWFSASRAYRAPLTRRARRLTDNFQTWFQRELFPEGRFRSGNSPAVEAYPAGERLTL